MQGKILSKAPCNEDLFEGGAHKKLAKVIADECDPDAHYVHQDGYGCLTREFNHWFQIVKSFFRIDFRNNIWRKPYFGIS